jgi:hypothetical protein
VIQIESDKLQWSIAWQNQFESIGQNLNIAIVLSRTDLEVDPGLIGVAREMRKCGVSAKISGTRNSNTMRGARDSRARIGNHELCSDILRAISK